MEQNPFPDPVDVPITGELDLHAFRPRDVGSLLPEYLRACRAKGLMQVRIVYGKGTGTLRAGVHRLLERMPEVASFRLAEESAGAWGATWVVLRRSVED
ncbi:MAG: Smr/MutS family protein [Verrucomicrobiales bacterium]|nr:Smr/MutS family protein [Verrucomicrobiales bacterium]